MSSRKEPAGRKAPGGAGQQGPAEGAAAKPGRRKKAAGADAKAVKPPLKPGARPRAAKPRTAAPVDPELRRALIARAAYFRAEKRGFAPGGEARDWLEAEAEVDLLLLSGQLPSA